MSIVGGGHFEANCVSINPFVAYVFPPTIQHVIFGILRTPTYLIFQVNTLADTEGGLRAYSRSILTIYGVVESIYG